LSAEVARWALLLGGALWLAHPYFSPRLIGTGDAVWYHNFLADAVTQFRAGVFPVYNGQSIYQFNGAVYPIRMAPYHQYLGGLLDLITARSLGFFALQHLTIIFSFLGGAVAAYLSLNRLAPGRRWEAALLALLYLLCPGVAGLAYVQDLYMSVMALPWVPLALAGAWLTFRENSWRALAMIVTGVGMLWWAHSPIALWVCLVVGAQQAVRLALASDRRAILHRGVPAVGFLGLLILYPFVSAFLLRAPGESIVPYTMDRTLLLEQISACFPACLAPLNLAASPLSQLQLGYALWAALVLSAAAAGWTRRTELALIAILGLLFACLLLPVPGLTAALWQSLPEPIVGLTLYWPMQRLYIVWAALVVIGTHLAIGASPAAWQRGWRVFLAAGVAWACWEIRSFHRRAANQSTTAAESSLLARPENVALQRHSYHLFGRQPDTMSHGVMDPQLETRLLDPETLRPLPAAKPVTDGWPVFTGKLDANPGILNLAPVLRLEPAKRYLLTFDFLPLDYTGVLQMQGPGFYREYVLPASGNARAFGTGPDAARTIMLFTSGTVPVEISLRFIPTKPGVRPESFSPFARFRLAEFDPSREPVAIESLIPLRVRVRSDRPALLETPRMSVPGYTATFNGQSVPVVRTPQGFVGVPVPAGGSEVEVRFTGPTPLRLAFGLSALAWVVLPPALWRLGRRPVD
jgi:hypothetical protein